MPGLSRISDFAVRDQVSHRAEMLWAVGIVIVIAVLVAVCGVLYLSPPGRETVRAVMSESGGIKSGTEVRIAGVTVGKVTDVALSDDKVDVTLSVDRTAFLGDQTSLDVRMLTVVGGAYVALLPSGSKPLGDRVIPASRTSVPYSISEVLDAAAKTTSGIDAPTMRGTAVALTNSFDAAPGAIHGIMSDVDTLTELFDKQQEQLKSVAAIGSEYTTAMVAQRQTLTEMIGRIHSVLPLIIGYKDRGIITYDALAELVLYVGDVLGEPYQARIKPPLQKIIASAGQTRDIAAKMSVAITQLRNIADKLTRTLHPNGVALDFGDQVIDDKSICIPLAGRRC
ncbi:MlaD family protein [Gordonia otitidis]|uniref:MlaD family protein n=1 Tax=Gordonia otitidis TaxID=249058 RepID=UPI001D15E1FD|nr:MlaD family protein [Gordonia otitidis]UEA57912.1 MlaD family protein [Gordonia otitidis]